MPSAGMICNSGGDIFYNPLNNIDGMISIVYNNTDDHVVIRGENKFMPAKIFEELSEEKRRRIIAACITEFSEYGYTGSSTNRMIRNAGISKGSLFQYFRNKEELYFYVLDCVIQELTEYLEPGSKALPEELFDRIIKYAELEFSWYIRNPEKGRLIIDASAGKDTAVCQKVEERYRLKGQDIYDSLLEDIDVSMFRGGKKKTADILKWFLKGFNEDFNTRISPQEDMDFSSLQHDYVKSLSDYMELLKSGILTEEKER